MSGSTLSRVQILLGALLFSTGGVAIKLSSFTGWQVSGFRGAVAAVAILLLFPSARRGWSWRSILVAVPYAATLTLFALANKETTAANAIFLQDSAPLYLLLLGPALLREQIRRSDLVFLAALALGIVLIFTSLSEPLATAPRPRLGNSLGIVSGVTWAFTLLGMRWIARRHATTGEEPLTAVVAGCFLAFLISSAYAFPVATDHALDWLIVLYLGVFQIGLAYALVTAGMRHISAFESSLLLLMEPVFSPLWAWLILAEATSRLALTGGAIILAATAIHTIRKRRVS